MRRFPQLTGRNGALAQRLRGYRHVVANGPWPGAWNAAQGGPSTATPADAVAVRDAFHQEIQRKGWLPR